jgi:hypothetical protein
MDQKNAGLTSLKNPYPSKPTQAMLISMEMPMAAGGQLRIKSEAPRKTRSDVKWGIGTATNPVSAMNFGGYVFAARAFEIVHCQLATCWMLFDASKF